MVFEFTQNVGAWRRIADVENRQSDNGFYVDPSNQLDIFPVTGGSTFTNNVYHDVILTVANDGTTAAYLDGGLAFTTNTTIMNINNANNPSNLLNFFLDNTVGGGQGEYSNANTALIRLYNAPLTSNQAATIGSNPFASGGTATGPEPASLLLVGLVLPVALTRFARRRNQ